MKGMVRAVAVHENDPDVELLIGALRQKAKYRAFTLKPSASECADLHRYGLLPSNCLVESVEIRFASDSALTISYEVFVEIQDVPMLVAALACERD